MADETHQAHVRGTPPGARHGNRRARPHDPRGVRRRQPAGGAVPHDRRELGTFDPNAALRNKRGQGPGLQDSEALRPAVWTDHDDEKARVTAAEADVKAAQAQLDQAKARLKDAKKS
jgi:hypothetical protein